MSTPLSNSISLTAQVTASSYWTEGPCENDVCNPSEVIDAQTASGINSGAGTRWVSKPDYINGTGSCSSQWINFNFASSKTGIVLNYANVQYGDTSDTFDGGFALNRRSCPNVSVAYNTVQDTFFELSAPDDYTCVIGSTIDNGVAERLDTISFKSSSKYNVNVKQLRFEWDTLVPRGSFGVKTCMMDVSEIFITRFPASTTTDVSTSSSGNSSLSSVAVAFIVIASIILACVAALFCVRHRNIEKRRMRAAELRSLRSGVVVE